MASLSHARYGKDNIRLYKTHRHDDGTQSVTEMTVCTMLEGDIARSWTHADNANIVATDTQKQTTYVLAKLHPVNPPELFASILGDHFLKQYSHISSAHVWITVHKWTRMTVAGKPHPHSFVRDGEEKRVVYAIANRKTGISIRSGLEGLLVLKSTGSQFHSFHRDEFTRLPETWDRILSTSVDAHWTWKSYPTLASIQRDADANKFDQAYRDATTITLETFATENSPSVQNTMYLMSEKILAAAEGVQSVEYSLPNKHYFEIDMSWYQGLKNTGKDAEVYAPQSDPNGLIQCVVERKDGKAKL
ncbi:Putative uricase [Septoria linicola]|uniref:Uricase n=1 Tax=Septoria linicola TaxID=215465 RepID=A0A9Q9B0D1_9PEZI|nr:putative uricase [Septoria linicola]USW55167.1 Putative uricase [Septoria linicola]